MQVEGNPVVKTALMRDTFEEFFSFFIFVSSCHLSLMLPSIGSLCQNRSLLIKDFPIVVMCLRMHPDKPRFLMIRFILYLFITGPMLFTAELFFYLRFFEFYCYY